MCNKYYTNTIIIISLVSLVIIPENIQKIIEIKYNIILIYTWFNKLLWVQESQSKNRKQKIQS